MRWLRSPVDGASLAVFRMLFGFILLADVFRYWPRIERLYLAPPFHFSYYGFEWVRPWPDAGMYVHFAVLGCLAVLIMLGCFYRTACWLFLLAFSYVFLLEQAEYLNHFYLVILLVFLLCLLPGQRVWSVDSWRRPGNATVPRWAPLAMVAMMELLLLYAGLVKVNADWLQGYPLRLWFASQAQLPIVGPLLAQPWFAVLGSYFAIVLHLLGAPLLLWSQTRLTVFVLYCVFHVANAVSFQIGIFPWVTIAGTLMFFAPDWPRRFALRVTGSAWLGSAPVAAAPGHPRVSEQLALAALMLFLVFNLLFPLRHWLYPGDVAWTEEGHRFSWRMKLRDKQGVAQFVVRDPATGRLWQVNLPEYLSERQIRKLATHPDMLLQFAHYLARRWREDYQISAPEVRATVRCSLNGRPRALLLDPDRDLAAIQRDLWPADWILPLDPRLSPGTATYP